MQALIVIPESFTSSSEPSATDLLTWPIAGIPLLMRTVLTAVRAGADEILLICSPRLSDKLVQQITEDATRRKVQIKVIRVMNFDPRAWSSRVILKSYVENSFLWLPWNWVTSTQSLTHLPLVDFPSVDWATPAYTTIDDVIREDASSVIPSAFRASPLASS